MNPASVARAAMPLFRWLIGAVAGALLMTANAANPGSAAGPLQGQWAGDRLHLVIDSQGGRVESDCASGQFAGPVSTTSEGRFTAKGSFESHTPGPQRADEPATAAAASYSGEVRDGVLKLSITPAGASEAQTYTLLAGARVKRLRCL